MSVVSRLCWKLPSGKLARAAAALAITAVLLPVAAVAAPSAVVDAALPTLQSMPHQLNLVGTMNAKRSIDLASQIAGQVREIAFTEGDLVEQGQVLLLLDEDVPRAELRQAEANFRLAELRHQRSERLLRQKAIAQSGFDESRAELDERRAALELAQARLDKATIRAPFTGRTGIANVSVGQYVTAGHPLVPLVAGHPIQLDFKVPERALAHVTVGRMVGFTVDSLGGDRFEAQITALEPRFDEASRSLRVRAELPNPQGRLRPGMFARLALTLGADEPVLTVPEEALMPSRTGYRVYEIVDGVARQRAVATGVRAGGRVAIAGGIDGSHPVVVTGQLRLSDGIPVEIRQTVRQLSDAEAQP